MDAAEEAAAPALTLATPAGLTAAYRRHVAELEDAAKAAEKAFLAGKPLADDDEDFDAEAAAAAYVARRAQCHRAVLSVRAYQDTAPK